MQNFRIVLFYTMDSAKFKVFYKYMKKSGIKVDAIYKNIYNTHTYFSDYSQIILDFGIKSYEEISKKVLFIIPYDFPYDSACEIMLADPQIKNTDISALCHKIPLIYGIAEISKKYNIMFDSSMAKYYEPLTLMIPSIQSSKKNYSISMDSLYRAIKLLSPDEEYSNFLSKASAVCNMRKSFFQCTETSIFWDAISEQKEIKQMQQKHQKELEARKLKMINEKSTPRINPELLKSQETNKLFIQLCELNSWWNNDHYNICLDAEFSDDEYDEEIFKIRDYKRMSTLIIPNINCFENVQPECIKTQNCLPYQRWILGLAKRKDY